MTLSLDSAKSAQELADEAFRDLLKKHHRPATLRVATPPEVREQVARAVSEQLARIKEEASAVGVPCETVHVENDIPWQAILDAAKDKRCDLIVMASHGRTGFSAVFLGSVTHKVLAQSSIPVLVCR